MRGEEQEWVEQHPKKKKRSRKTVISDDEEEDDNDRNDDNIVEEEEEEENIGIIKKEMDKGNGSKENALPPPTKRRKTKQSVDNDDGDDSNNDDDNDDDNVEDNGDEENVAPIAPALPIIKKMFVHSDGFPEGAIVRIKLRDFVVYDKVELWPGPNLNMIIGPNGTGKSTIVCAIALGLGGAPNLLGRAKDLKDFTRTGADKTSIEIELKRRRSNLIIKRTWKNGSNSSKWIINGEPTTKEKVLEEIRKLNIQVDNLCQFLPQDKVSEFAQMSNIELLKATQRAAGATQLSEWHEKLIQLKTEEKQLGSSVDGEREQLEVHRARNARLQAEVQRYQEREQILSVVKDTEHAIQIHKSRAAKANVDALRTRISEQTRLVKELKADTSPQSEEIHRLEGSIKSMEEKKKKAFEKHKKLMDETETKQNLVDAALNECDGARKTIISLKKREKERANKIEQEERELKVMKRDLEKLEAELKQAGLLDEEGNDVTLALSQIQATQGGGRRRASQGNLEEQMFQVKGELGDIFEAISQHTTEIKKVQEELSAVSSEAAEFVDSTKRLNYEKDDLERQLRTMDDMKNKRLNQMRNYASDTYKALMWLRNNQGRFKKPVLEPMCMEIDLTDTRFAEIVETVISQRALLTFVCQTPEDYTLFSQLVMDEQRLRVSVCEYSHKRLSDYERPASNEQVRDLGFSGYIFDLIRAPEPVLVALCHTAYIHSIPVSLDEVDHHRVENSRFFKQYVAGNTNYNIRVAYGNTSTRATRVKESYYLSNAIDHEAKKELETKINEIRDQLEEVSKRLLGYEEAEKKLRSKHDKLHASRKTWAEKKKAWVEKKSAFTRKSAAYVTKCDRVANLKSQDDNEELETQRTKMRVSAIKRGRHIVEICRIQREACEAFQERTVATLAILQYSADLNVLKTMNAEAEARIKEAERSLKNMEDEFKRARSRQRDMAAQTQGAIREAYGEDQDKIAEVLELSKTNLDTLEESLIANQARAELFQVNNPAILEEFNQRKKEIQALETRFAERESKLTKIRADIAKLREKWEVQLQAMVEKISKAFSKAFTNIGCSGEVDLEKIEDNFDKWGIQIKVKFRDSEKLQVLTGQRQSGGERSVSTMMYLMAMQELSNSPFRVVDEINQGMDPRNERLVHGHLVDIACRPETSQYFLITPKLLPDLAYSDKMKVLCIFNGEWIGELGSTMKCVKDWIQKKRRTVQAIAA